MRRCVLQLAALGYILEPAYALDAWWLVLLISAAMVAVAAAEAVSRPSASYKVSVNATNQMPKKKSFLHA